MPADVASAELTNDAPKVFPRSGVLYDTFNVRWFGLRSNRSLFFLFFCFFVFFSLNSFVLITAL